MESIRKSGGICTAKRWNKNFSRIGNYGKTVEEGRKLYGKRVAKIGNLDGKAYYCSLLDLQPVILPCDTYSLFCIYISSPIKKAYSQKDFQHRRIYNER